MFGDAIWGVASISPGLTRGLSNMPSEVLFETVFKFRLYFDLKVV